MDSVLLKPVNGKTPSEYLAPREGWPKLVGRLANGPVTVGYLGGSLTMMKQGWRPLFHAWLNQRYPRETPHRELHVGRGGVGSASGAFFVQNEICGHAPDLVFVEYAINDSYDFLTPPAVRREAVEGIVRSVRMRHPDSELCFVYMHHILRTEAIDRAIEDHEAVAAHYGLPSIRVGQFLRDLVEGGEWSFRGEDSRPELLRDECHPVAAGNRLIADLMSAAFEGLVQHSTAFDVAARRLPSALTQTPLEGGKVVPVEDGMIQGPFEKERRQVGNYGSPVSWISLPTGSCLRVRPDGRLFGLFVVVGPRSGVVRVRGGTFTASHSLLDRWCTYERISTCIVAPDLGVAPGSGEEVVIELSDEIPDYTVCPKLEAPPTERRLDVIGLFLL